MSKPKRELQILANWLHTGAQLINVTDRPATPSAIGGELESHEVAEITAIEIQPPYALIGGLPEDLRRVQFVLDSNPPEPYNMIPAHADRLVHAPAINMLNGFCMYFGKPLWNVDFNNPLSILQATCPKYTKTLSLDALAAAGITGNYRITVYGYRYKASELPGLFPTPFGGSAYITDIATERSSQVIEKKSLMVTEDTWTQLPGGLDQAVPKIFNFIRQAFNVAASTPNADYEMRFNTGTVGVAVREEDLYFDYAIQKKVALIKGLGVRAPVNISAVWWETEGDRRPKNRWPVITSYNPLHCGDVAPLLALPNMWKAISLLQDPIVIADEKAVLKFVDNGAAVGAGNFWCVVNGLMVDFV